MLTLENLKSLFSESPNAYLVLLPDSPVYTIAAANNSFLRYAHAPAEEIIGKGIFEAFPSSPENDEPNGMSKGMRALRASLDHALLLKRPNKGVIQRYDVENAGQYETRFWAYDMFPILDEHGQVQFIVQNPVDITGSLSTRDESEARPKSGLKFQDNLFHDYPDAIGSLDLYGNFLSANKVLLKLTECTKEKLLSSSFISFIAEVDFERVFNNFHRTLRGEIQHFETLAVGAMGSQYILSITALPIIINEEIVGVQIIAKDITAFREAEKQVAEHHARVANILESITDAFFAVDRNWMVTYWNKEAEQILSVPRESVIGKNLWDIFQVAVQLRFYTEYHRAISENVSVRFEEYFPPANIWLEISAFPSEQGLSVYFKDITERKNTETQLVLEKEKYRDLFNLTPVPKWVYDVIKLKFLDVNESAIELYGYTREEFLSMKLTDLWLPEDSPIMNNLLEQRELFGKFSSSLVRHIKKSGEIIFVTTTANSVAFENINSQLVSVIDYTEKLRTQQQLEVSEQRFKALVQDGSDLIAILDEAGHYSYVSPTSKAVLGIEADFFIGKNAFEFIHEEDRDRVTGLLASAIIGKTVKVPPYRFKDANNTYRWIETIITNMLDHPAVEGIVANSRDVTERIENEKTIRESVERYNIVSKATSDAIWDWDVTRNIILWNKGIKGIFGFKEQLYPSEWWNEQVHPDDREKTKKIVDKMVGRKKSRLSREFRFRCADGNYKYVLDRVFLLYDVEGNLLRMTGAMQDITERVAYTKAIEDQNERLRQISWEHSHILRAPLSSVLGLADLILEETDERTKKELVQLLKQSAVNLDVVIKNIVKKTDVS